MTFFDNFGGMAMLIKKLWAVKETTKGGVNQRAKVNDMIVNMIYLPSTYHVVSHDPQWH